MTASFGDDSAPRRGHAEAVGAAVDEWWRALAAEYGTDPSTLEPAEREQVQRAMADRAGKLASGQTAPPGSVHVDWQPRTASEVARRGNAV